MQRPLNPDEDLRPGEGTKPEGSSDVANEFETKGPEIKTDKTELQKIIERNRQQVEEEDDELREVKQEHQRQEEIERSRERVERFHQEKPTPKTSKRTDDDNDDDAQHIIRHADEVVAIDDPQRQIDRIVALAVSKDPFYAVRLAKHLDDNYILDQVHDRLVEDQVREQLIKKGLLPEL